MDNNSEYDGKLAELINTYCTAHDSGIERQYLLPNPVHIGTIDGQDCFCVAFRDKNITVAFNKQKMYLDRVEHYDVIEYLSDRAIANHLSSVKRFIDGYITHVPINVNISENYKELIYREASSAGAIQNMQLFTELSKQAYLLFERTKGKEADLNLEESKIVHRLNFIRSSCIMDFRLPLADTNWRMYENMTEEEFIHWKDLHNRSIKTMNTRLANLLEPTEK